MKPFKTPLKESGIGTIIGGSPKQLKILAPPGECFPFEGDEDNELRFYDETTLPSEIKNITSSFNDMDGL